MTTRTCTTCLRALPLRVMQGSTCRQCAAGKRAAALHTRVERAADPLNTLASAWRHPITPGALTPTT